MQLKTMEDKTSNKKFYGRSTAADLNVLKMQKTLKNKVESDMGMKVERGLHFFLPIMIIFILLFILGPILSVGALLDGVLLTLELKILVTVFLIFLAMFQINILPWGLAFVASYTALLIGKANKMNNQQVKQLANYLWRKDTGLNIRFQKNVDRIIDKYLEPNKSVSR